MEPAPKDRADRQAEAKAPAHRANSRPAPREKVVDAAVAEPARVKAAAAAADRAREERAVNAVKTVDNEIEEDIIMPGFNGSGPMGAGPMTGWGRGLCGRPAGAGNLPATGRGYGFGYGRGMGFRRGAGRGLGRGYGPAAGGYGTLPETGYGYPASKADQIEMLRSNAEAMQNSLEAIQQKIAELEKQGSE